MNPMRAAYCRVFQTAFRAALPLLPYREPELLSHVEDIAGVLGDRGIESVLVVTDSGILSAGLLDRLMGALASKGIAGTIFSGTSPNPTLNNVEEAYALYRAHGCTAIVGFGGGSAMDCAKGVGIRVARPKTALSRMRGVLKVHARLPLLIAVPTTAGTGSEVTLAAVLTDSDRHYKYAINDFVLIPRYAVHDYRLTVGLPAQLTATTGMDALTHAVEAYIGRSTTAYTRKAAGEAVSLIHGNLLRAYHDGSDVDARRNMLLASYKAGIAFTQSYVGYVHGIAHSLGGQYGVPHGLANAVILPHVLRAYGSAATRKLASLARVAGVAAPGADDGRAAEAFIAWIEGMNREMGIPRHIECIRAQDVPAMAEHCDTECNPLYPVPRLMDRCELERMYAVVSGTEEAQGTAESASARTVAFDMGASMAAAPGRPDGPASNVAPLGAHIVTAAEGEA